MYVDDEVINLMAFEQMFRKDFEVHGLNSATEALNYLKDNEVDLIVTDQRMPSMTGVEFLKKLMDIVPEVPPNRIIVSGYTKDDDIQDAFKNYNLYDFVEKPWEYSQLKEILESAMQ